MKKAQNLPNKSIHTNNSSGKPLPNNSNYSRNQSPHNSNYRARSPNQRKSRDFSQNRYSRSNSRHNQSRATIHDRIQTDQNFHLKPFPIHTLGIDTFLMIDQEILRTIEIILIIGTDSNN